MPLIEGFLHRKALAGITARWTVDRPETGDVQRIKQIVNFNFYISRLWADALTRGLLRELHSSSLSRTPIRTKGALKDFVTNTPSYTNPRIEEMIARYRRFPEDFYRETPVDGAYYTVDGPGGPRLVGTTRIKRARRIAEKSARQTVDFILDRIRSSADDLADERALQLGVSRDQLFTGREEMAAEFAHAERRVLKSVKQGTTAQELAGLPIPDVVGVKLLIESHEYERLLQVVSEFQSLRIIETDRHDHAYRATNVRAVYELPTELLRSRPPDDFVTGVLARRGIDVSTLARDYRSFLDMAETEVSVEIIVSTFEEFLESEIGRSIHEERVLRQRTHPDYGGYLATNVRNLMIYVFDVSRSPLATDMDDVPIKLWVKYLPETIEQKRWDLFLPDVLTLDGLDIDG